MRVRRGELAIGERNGAAQCDAGAGEVRLRDIDAAVCRERARLAVRLGIGGEAEPEIVHHDGVALGDVDLKDDVAALGAAAQRELHVAEEAGAEQTEAREEQLLVVDVERVTGTERYEALDDATERRGVAADLDAFEDVAEPHATGSADEAR